MVKIGTCGLARTLMPALAPVQAALCAPAAAAAAQSVALYGTADAGLTTGA